MARWEPDARGRLQQAALALYARDGFERTTVAQIAERAGLTERTFFRHFADKREVLFDGTEVLREAFVGAARAAPADAGPLEAAAEAARAGARLIEEERGLEVARTRSRVVAANAELQERETVKMALLGDALAAALVERGEQERRARLAAAVAIAVFRVAFGRWVAEDEGHTLSALVEEAMEDLRGLVAPKRASRRPTRA